MRLAAIALIIAALFSGCAEDDSSYFAVAADFPSYDALRAVTGSGEDILMLLPPGV